MPNTFTYVSVILVEGLAMSLYGSVISIARRMCMYGRRNVAARVSKRYFALFSVLGKIGFFHFRGSHVSESVSTRESRCNLMLRTNCMQSYILGRVSGVVAHPNNKQTKVRIKGCVST
jgi:hypothetical protein